MTRTLRRLAPSLLLLVLSACGLARCTPAPLDRAALDGLYARPLPPPAGPLAVYFVGHSLVGRDMPAMLAELARASGAGGMCGGQALDIEATGKPAGVGIGALERLHAMKTGALLRSAVRLGALAAEAGRAQRDALDRYANALGLAFQIRDDLLDIEGDAATLGKTAGKDLMQDKATFPALLGLEASRARLAALKTDMDDALAALPVDTTALAALARIVVERDR